MFNPPKVAAAALAVLALSAASASAAPAIGPNVDVTNMAGPQGETSVAINPRNSQQLVSAVDSRLGTRAMRASYSNDGGASWTGVDLPLPAPRSTNGSVLESDPSVAWDLQGDVYIGQVVVYLSSGGSPQAFQIGVQQSADGGRTWRQTLLSLHSLNGNDNVKKATDKPYIAVDTNPTSPYVNTVYAAFDDTVSGTGGKPSTSAIRVARSSDGGQTFSSPVTVSDTHGGGHFNFSANPFVGPDGRLYVAWHDTVDRVVRIASSADGGRSFGPAVDIASTTIGWEEPIPAEAVRQIILYPTCGADRTSGPRRGTLYCAWADDTGANGVDVLASSSTDGGTSWSAPVRVNDDPVGTGQDQFNPWLAIDQATGNVVVSWHDTRADPAMTSTFEYIARSTDGAQTFEANTRVADQPTDESTPDASSFQYGDYDGLDVYGNVAHPVWTDRRASVIAAGLAEEEFTANVGF